MLRKSMLVVALVVSLAAAGLVVRRVGFRCDELPIASVGLRTASICYSWFRPHVLTFSDRSGRVFYHGLVAKSFSLGDLPREEYVDLFGSGRISAFSTNHLEPEYGFVGAQEISTHDDGRVDLVLEFHGNALTKAVRVDVGRCSSWKSTSIKFTGQTVIKQVCTDPAAFAKISAVEARGIVARMQIPADHEVFAAGRLESSRGKRIGHYLPM